MQTVWKVNGNSKLLLFFSGWAMDENPTAHLKHEGFDLCTCFDYTNLETSAIESWRSYSEIVLVAWSTGIWAAEQVLGNLNFPITEAIAINGTPTTVHNETGIPRVIFQGTYDNLTAQSMQKFQRRMFGNAAAYNAFIPFLPQLDLESQKAELANVLSVDFETLETGLIKWDKAIVGTDDAIFPPQHQLRYWSSCRDLAFFRDLACKVSTGCPDNVVEIIEMRFPHYPFLNSTDFFLSSFVIQ